MNDRSTPPDADLPSRLVAFYRSASAPCGYLPGRTERRLVVDLANDPDPQGLFDRLTDAGFRRSDTYAYRPICPACSACVPIRVPVAGFQPTRSQRRTAKRNRDLRVAIELPTPDREQFDLFQRYQQHRHTGGGMAEMDADDYAAMVERSPIATRLITLREADGRLVAACLTDGSDAGLSAVYSFYDPDQPARSLGTALILALIDQAARLGLTFVYLGYWIAGADKMAYKNRFGPFERLSQEGWTTVGAER